MANQPKKTSVWLEKDKWGKKEYRVRWIDLDTGSKQHIYTGTTDRVKAEIIRDKKRTELSEALRSGGYDTIESRTRKFIEVFADETKKAKTRIGGKGHGEGVGNALKLACKKTGTGSTTAIRNIATVRYIDHLESVGEIEKSKQLAHELNRCPNDAYKLVPKEHRTTNRKNGIDIIINNMFYRLVRLVDERCELFGGEKHRTSCIERLKEIANELDEWRASE